MDSGLELDEEGRFLHDGVPVEHPGVSAAFQRGLEQARDGRWLVRFGADWAFVRVRATPFVVVAIRARAGLPILQLSDGSDEALRPEALWEAEDGVLYAALSRGAPARFARLAQGALAPWLVEEQGHVALLIAGRVAPIARGPVPPPPPPPESGGEAP